MSSNTDRRSTANKLDNGLSWEADVALGTNPLVRRQLTMIAAGVGLMMAVILTIVFAAIGEFEETLIMLLISLLTAVGLGLLLFLVSLLFFGNRIRVYFNVNNKGASWQVIDKRAVVGSRLALLTGTLSGDFRAAGAGLLATARQNGSVGCQSLSSVEFDQRHRMAVLHSRDQDKLGAAREEESGIPA